MPKQKTDAKGNKVRFVRIRGKVVPIKVKPGQGGREGFKRDVRKGSNRGRATGYAAGAAGFMASSPLGRSTVKAGSKTVKQSAQLAKKGLYKYSASTLSKGFRPTKAGAAVAFGAAATGAVAAYIGGAVGAIQGARKSKHRGWGKKKGRK